MSHVRLTVHSQCRFKAGEMSQSSDMLIDPHVQNQRSPPTSQNKQTCNSPANGRRTMRTMSALLLQVLFSYLHPWNMVGVLKSHQLTFTVFKTNWSANQTPFVRTASVVKYWLEPLSAFEIWLLQMLKTSEVQDLRNYVHCGHSCQWVCTCPNSLKDWKKNFCGAAGT